MVDLVWCRRSSRARLCGHRAVPPPRPRRSPPRTQPDRHRARARRAFRAFRESGIRGVVCPWTVATSVPSRRSTGTRPDRGDRRDETERDICTMRNAEKIKREAEGVGEAKPERTIGIRSPEPGSSACAFRRRFRPAPDGPRRGHLSAVRSRVRKMKVLFSHGHCTAARDRGAGRGTRAAPGHSSRAHLPSRGSARARHRTRVYIPPLASCHTAPALSPRASPESSSS